jgi:protocatechuate 3,4-dioxygenase beta subunit
LDRRKFLRVSIVGSLFTTIPASAANKISVTPAETEGPFYPIVAQEDKDFDLTQVRGKTTKAKGKHIFVRGKVIDTEGNPIPNVTIDLWQANAAGRYHHPHDENNAPVDENFQSWAILSTNSEGNFNLKTVFPGAYPVDKSWARPPHIHFKIAKKGYVEVITQMYFPDQALNNMDKLIQKKTAAEQKQMIATQSLTEPDTYDYTIVIELA